MTKTKLFVVVCGLVMSISLAAFIFLGDSGIDEKMIVANLEALAEIEGSGSNFGPQCSKTATPGRYHMKLCKNCTNYGSYAMDEFAFCPSK